MPRLTPEEIQNHLEHQRIVQWYKDTQKTWWGFPRNTVYLIDEDSFREIEGVADFKVVDKIDNI